MVSKDPSKYHSKLIVSSKPWNMGSCILPHAELKLSHKGNNSSLKKNIGSYEPPLSVSHFYSA